MYANGYSFFCKVQFAPDTMQIPIIISALNILIYS